MSTIADVTASTCGFMYKTCTKPPQRLQFTCCNHGKSFDARQTSLFPLATPQIRCRGVSNNFPRGSYELSNFRANRYNAGRTSARRVNHRMQQAGPVGASAVGPLPAEDVQQVRNVVLLDLDNCMHVFSKIRREVPSGTLIRGFIGISSNRARLQSREMLLWLEEKELDVASFAKAKVGTTVGTWPVFITVCGGNKDAADFILTLDVGRLDQALAKDVPFTIISSDHGFDDVLKCVPDRPVERIDPRVRKGNNVMQYFSRIRSTDAAKEMQLRQRDRELIELLTEEK
mmetsp:Transcript_37374/g.62910  ORF Transcript_37374/g.62910 Transcript_37374/m.62910 type:complete len:287 (+) Transcript_37374:334-1194(+)|eukprot:CAMPEP_0198204686 /NCGR_PEP_ID=MMETSP1445-20131203/8121_1 /TAXON_ID=36898 /ORGANISM="Pyramimonas sp., Strain CCMP2087" /LENGTH=286 /DNA_ID=CAMNT_0043876679 /DNA_START=314 /DNA_END=1174 /DNA_ORIENTATION=-